MNHLTNRVLASVAFLAFAWLVSFPMTANAGLLHEWDFEGGNFSVLNTNGLCCSHSAVIVGNPVRAGKYAAKVTLNSDDKGYIFGAWTNPAKRAELRKYETGPKVGSERWYGVSMYVDPSWKDTTSDPNGTIVMQWHGPSDSGEGGQSPHLSLKITKDNRWRVTTVYDANAISTSSSVTKINRDVGAVTKGVWVDWVIHAKWHYNSTGRLEVWKNGTKVVNYSGPNTYNDKTQLGLFFGIYKSWYSREQPSPRNTLIIYHDEVRIGDHMSSYEEVAPTRAGPSLLSAPTDLRIIGQ
jgi:Polysaccharide lyase